METNRCAAATAMKFAVVALLLNTSVAANNSSIIQTKVDILFIVDYSGSTSEEDVVHLKDALHRAVSALTIGKDKAHVGIIVYSCDTSTHLNLADGTSERVVNQSIEDLPKNGSGKDVVGEAMDIAIQKFRDEARNDTIRILVLISDGCTACHPTMFASCYGSLGRWNVYQCRTKGRQCATPKDYLCHFKDCGPPTVNSIVYNQAEVLKAQYGVNLVTIIMTVYKGFPQCEVNMKCWATNNMSFYVGGHKELAKKLRGIVTKVIHMNPPRDCRYIEQQGAQCKTNASGKGTPYECVKKIRVTEMAPAEHGGNPCPPSPIIRICNLEDCYYGNATKGEVVYYAIKLVVVKRKPPKESSLRFFVLGALILTLIGTVVGIVILLVILLKKKRRRGKSTGVQMTQRESPSKRGGRKRTQRKPAAP